LYGRVYLKKLYLSELSNWRSQTPTQHHHLIIFTQDSLHSQFSNMVSRDEPEGPKGPKDPSETDLTPKKLPKGVVLGPDGKPYVPYSLLRRPIISN
jgi:hypothetical protein